MSTSILQLKSHSGGLCALIPEHFSVLPSREFTAEADRFFGEETFYTKVETSLPEPKRKVWEKKAANGDDE